MEAAQWIVGSRVSPVVSRNSITTECADFQSVEDPVRGLVSDCAHSI